jgi:hypothetical protein
MIDYTIYYKRKYRPEDDWSNDCKWDLFISAFNSSERVQKVFTSINASEKHWLILPEYKYLKEEFPSGKTFVSDLTNEADYIQQYFSEFSINADSCNLCIDITGFMRPHLMFMIKYLMVLGVHKFDVLYTDPGKYVKKEETKFSDEVVLEVRQVAGYEGNHSQDTSNDVLLIGSGYDHQLIAHIAENKAKTRKIQIFGFPSLQADMYQENVLRASLAQEAVGGSAGDDLNSFFAPANDPFVTASILQEIVGTFSQKKPITNLYLSPLSAKPQVLGFVLFYLTEWQDRAASIIFPFCGNYTRETSKGISKIWKYTVELPQPSSVTVPTVS